MNLKTGNFVELTNYENEQINGGGLFLGSIYSMIASTVKLVSYTISVCKSIPTIVKPIWPPKNC